MEVLTSMKQSLENVSGKLSVIDSRMDKFEMQQKMLEAELKPACKSNPKNRERIVPPILAVIV